MNDDAAELVASAQVGLESTVECKCYHGVLSKSSLTMFRHFYLPLLPF